jgi:N-acyl-D-amino-acid deacylase
MIDQARRRGVNVRADQYAYAYSSSGLSIRVPAWALEGGRQKVAERLKDEATWQKIKGEMKAMLAARGLSDLSFGKVTSYRADPSLNGLTMKEIAAKLKGADDAETQFEVAREMLINGGAGMVYHVMGEEDIARIMRHPQVSVASDAGILRLGEGVPHPRGYGNNARVLGHYVRDLKVITLSEAIRKMTSLPAKQFGIADRGMIKAGFAADLVVFDPAKIADQATYEKPHQFPVGIPWVVVNGAVVLQNGELTAARPGQALTRKTPKPARPAV